MQVPHPEEENSLGRRGGQRKPKMELGMRVRIGYSRRRKEWPAGCQEVTSIRALVGKGKENSREFISDDFLLLVNWEWRQSAEPEGSRSWVMLMTTMTVIVLLK